jgi:uncharacterized protein (DUF1810 family)
VSFLLDRFLEAQAPVYARVVDELKQGRKTTHWMWFVFPQFRGLGTSHMSRKYAIASLEEAVAYLAHPLLGPRLRECTKLVLDVQGRSLEQIFGHVDALKFCSSMTLFSEADHEPLFHAALEKYCGGMADGATVRLLRSPDPAIL